MKRDKKKLQRQVRTMELKLKNLQQKMTSNQAEWAKTFQDLSQSPVKLKVNIQNSTGEVNYLLVITVHIIYITVMTVFMLFGSTNKNGFLI